MDKNVNSKNNSLELRVKDAFKEDAGKGIVRIDTSVMQELNLKAGDVVEIVHPHVNNLINY